MRDPNRLYKFYENLRDMHMAYLPDWRFGQFILNFTGWYYAKYKKDIFYIEDDKILKIFREFFDDVGVKYI